MKPPDKFNSVPKPHANIVQSPGSVAKPNLSSPALGLHHSGMLPSKPSPPRRGRAKPKNGKLKGFIQAQATMLGPTIHAFKSRDLLHLRGGLEEFSPLELEINGSARLPLDRRKFLVLLVLVCHSLALSGVKAPMKVPPAPLLSAQMILDSIKQYIASQPFGMGVFLGNDPQDVTRVIYDLREMFEKIGASRNLIMRGPSNWGCRLSTPPHQVWLTLVESGGKRTIKRHGRRLRSRVRKP